MASGIASSRSLIARLRLLLSLALARFYLLLLSTARLARAVHAHTPPSDTPPPSRRLDCRACASEHSHAQNAAPMLLLRGRDGPSSVADPASRNSQHGVRHIIKVVIKNAAPTLNALPSRTAAIIPPHAQHLATKMPGRTMVSAACLPPQGLVTRLDEADAVVHGRVE